MELLNACRTCLTQNLGENCGTIFDICENDVKFSELLQLIAPQIDLDDENLTKIICNDCMNQFRGIFKFIQKILHSNDELKKVSDLEEIIEYPIDEQKLDENYTLVEIEPSETNLILTDFPCDEMIVEVNENEEEITQYQCTKCSKIFEDLEAFEDHLKIHSPKSKIHACKQCNEKFSTVLKLRSHEIIHSDLVIQIKSKSDIKTYQCTMCKKEFIMGQELIDHLHQHKGSSLYKCSICGKSYSQESRLKIHLESHAKKKFYLCTECGKSFNRNSNLRQHLLRHSGIKRFNCPQCPAKFVSKGNLNAHMTTHSKKKPYECNICGSSFTQSYSLVKHNRIHTGDRPFQCEVCEMRFYSSDHLKRHMRTHTGERPFKCKFCPKSFAQNGDLNKHKRLHIGENTYICDFPGCKDAFRLLSELRDHQKIHYASDQKTNDKLDIIEEIEEVTS